MATLDTRLRDVVGGATAKALAEAFDLQTLGDLLRHYPRTYRKRGELTTFAGLEVGEHATVFAEITRVDGRWIRREPRKLHKTEVVIRDGTGRSMILAIFNRQFVLKDLKAGRQAYFSGKVELFNGRIQLANPAFQLVDDDAGVVTEEFAGALVPIYPATAKLTTFSIARAVKIALDVVDVGAEPLPPELREAHGLPSLEQALRGIHRPGGWADVQLARLRLTWDEAFVLQAVLAQRRAAARSVPGTARVPGPDGLLAAFDARLPFELTAGQMDVGAVLGAELAATSPMHRLLQGEVGSGKTVVALRAMLAVVDAGGQAALLAPTEVLAQQHARSIAELLGELGLGPLLGAEQATSIALLTGSLGATARRTALGHVASGEAGLVIGTHALLSEGVEFADLGLVVVDEQHRFGVEQRDALRGKGAAPHVLVMTATPIPRTVAMTVYGDLEVSTLTELPKGRAPVHTAVVPVAEKPAWLETAWTRVREQVAQGRQAFIVCPRIGGEGQPGDGDGPADGDGSGGDLAADDRRPTVAVLELYPQLVQGPLAGLRVEALHGRMAADSKEDLMRRFTAGAVDVLVATTVIEVGVDVPNAAVMVVMDAERFGVSQLHQLRGRIGRGAHPGLCLLVSAAEPGPALERLAAVAATSDGFALARVDLEQRREGDVLGARQSGRRTSLKMLQLLRDEEVIREARERAALLVADDPQLERYPALRQAVADLVDEQAAPYLQKA